MKSRDFLRGLAEIAAASPLFLFAPLYRRWHLHWGATDVEVAAPMPGDRLSAVILGDARHHEPMMRQAAPRREAASR